MRCCIERIAKADCILISQCLDTVRLDSLWSHLLHALAQSLAWNDASHNDHNSLVIAHCSSRAANPITLPINNQTGWSWLLLASRRLCLPQLLSVPPSHYRLRHLRRVELPPSMPMEGAVPPAVSAQPPVG